MWPRQIRRISSWIVLKARKSFGLWTLMRKHPNLAQNALGSWCLSLDIVNIACFLLEFDVFLGCFPWIWLLFFQLRHCGAFLHSLCGWHHEPSDHDGGASQDHHGGPPGAPSYNPLATRLEKVVGPPPEECCNCWLIWWGANLGVRALGLLQGELGSCFWVCKSKKRGSKFQISSEVSKGFGKPLVPSAREKLHAAQGPIFHRRNDPNETALGGDHGRRKHLDPILGGGLGGAAEISCP